MKMTKEYLGAGEAVYSRGNVKVSVVQKTQDKPWRTLEEKEYYFSPQGNLSGGGLPKVRGFRRNNRMMFYTAKTKNIDETVENLLSDLHETDLYESGKAITE